MNIFGGPVVVQVTWWHTTGGYSNKWSQWRNKAPPRVPGSRSVATSIAYEAEVTQDMVILTNITMTKSWHMNKKCLDVMETMPCVHWSKWHNKRTREATVALEQRNRAASALDNEEQREAATRTRSEQEPPASDDSDSSDSD